MIFAAGTVPPFFTLMTLVLSSVVVVSLLFSRFKQSLLVGYFLCGLILANSGILEWANIDDDGLIHQLSEIGIVLLLFTIGIEFSIGELKNLRRPALLGGGVQVLLSIFLGMGMAFILDLNFSTALILGFIISLSSTAVSIKTFQDLGLPESPQARVALGMAIFQDLAAILFMILVPVLAAAAASSDAGSNTAYLDIGLALLKGIAFTIGVVVLSRFGFPQILDAVAKTRSRELFTVTVIGLCAAVALVSGMLGLSPALGAFAAGVVVSESIYSHRVLSDVLPFKDLFLTIFFVSVGLLIDLKEVTSQWLGITLLTLTLILVKGAIVFLAAKLSGLQFGRCLIVTAALCSTGEFSIVLLNRAQDFTLFTPEIEQLILASTALSMSIVPTFMKSMMKFSKRLRSIKLSHADAEALEEQIDHLTDHIIICGYGPVGENLHKNLNSMHIPVVVLELNPATVKRLNEAGTLSIFADARDTEALHAAKIKNARGLAITFPDKELAVSTTHTARAIKPDIILYARCKFKADLSDYEKAGINHILLDEEQSGRAMIKSVMQCYSTEFDESWI